MPVNLTPNAIATINDGDVNLKPLVQVLDIKQMGSAQERFRLLVSDSVLTQHAMLGTQLNDRVKTGLVKKGSIIQLIDYICSQVQKRKIIVVLNLETIIPDCEIIGNPKMVSDAPAQNALPNTNSMLLSTVGYNNLSSQSHGSNMHSIRPALSSQSHDGNMQSFRPTSSTQNQGGKMHTFQPALGAQNYGNDVQSFRPTVQPPYQPPPSYRNHGAVMKNEAPARIIPINALNPYQGRWAIKARITAKGDLRRYNNARGDGKVFSFDLLDSDGGEIRVTCFNAVVDRFYDAVEVGKVYLISKGSLKPAQKNFNHLKNDWEIFLEATSTVDLCPEEDGSIPQQQFSFKPISEIESAENNSIFDVIGIVISVNPSVPILRKNGMETQRRILNLKDGSGWTIELTLWGDFCNKEGQKLQEMLFINPDIPEAHAVKDWFDRGGCDVASMSISRDIVQGGPKNEARKTVSQIKHEGLGRSDKPDWATVRASISFIKTDTFCYTACPLMIGDRQCNKKVTRSGNSRWQCDRCNQEFDECDYRYLLQIQIQDHTGLTWVTAFQESGEEILGYPAKELYLLKYESNDTRFADIIRSRLFYQYLFRLKIKEEMYGDEQRVKITIFKADKVSYSSESRYMLDLISKVHAH
ncbi:REPLICATION PROTEIN A 70 KDA DNA-BINDING SUBUNIT A [Salix koriyanagi]|uniref:REPLICATION PROTEIN A 70 kDa DNA-BINDING SUBUNIT A n=1 Tax=Salix koriyanagi TaxID=2511006 RepID=A0A9Q0W5V9_9ROSI|nr:REPLICATION PROTEIN A 70 KDA DNA-BINDING SUBUNIT A [Salix koriyanagi]